MRLCSARLKVDDVMHQWMHHVHRKIHRVEFSEFITVTSLVFMCYVLSDPSEVRLMVRHR